MKNKILYLPAVLLLFSYTSCNKISESLERDTVIVDTVYFEIPVISNLSSPVTITGISTTINLDQQIRAQAQDLSTANLSAVRLKSINMGLAEIAKDSIDIKNNFANLQSIKISLTDGIKSDSLASINIPSAALSSALALTPVISPETLKPYLTNSSMEYTVTLKAKAVTTAVMNVGLALGYTVKLIK